MIRLTDEEIWRNRIETSDIGITDRLGEPVPIRKSPSVEYMYLSDYVEPCWRDIRLECLYNIGDFGDGIKSFRLKTQASVASFYVNGILISKYKNLVPNQWYDFHQGFSISNKAAPGAWRYLEIEYDIVPETTLIEVSYIQLISYSKKHKDYVYLGTYGCEKGSQ